MRHAALLPILLLTAGCRSDAERSAAEVAELRDRAADGLVAIDRYCAKRDTVLATAERGEPGAELALEQTLYAPDRVDDYCEEFRFHTHGAEEDEPAASDPTGRAPQAEGPGR